MEKITFTSEHKDSLDKGLLKMLYENGTVTTKMGQPLGVAELLHTTTINSLNDIRIGLKKRMERMEEQDKWVQGPTQQAELEAVKEKYDIVDLIIGYKRYTAYQREIVTKKAELANKIAELKESQKTPTDKISELEAELKTLEDENA